MNDFQARQPKGIPIGGQWSTKAHGESEVSLTGGTSTATRPSLDPAPTEVLDRFFGDAERHDALLSRGYVPPTFFAALTDPRTTARRREWWQQAMLAAESNPDGDGYPAIPDDYNPSNVSDDSYLGGHSVEGKRRSHRIKFSDDGVTVRMHSKRALKRFARESGSTFSAPFSAIDESGRTITGSVLITENGAGSWTVEPQGIQGATAAKISEAIASRLEGRRPTKSPAATGALIERHRARLASHGTEIARPNHNSTWISAVGYNAAAGVMVTETSSGRTYGHHVDAATFNAVRNDRSPGVAFNAMVKGSPGAAVERCGTCSRMYATANGHTCPGGRKEPAAGPKRSNVVQRQYAEQIADGATRLRRTSPPAASTSAGAGAGAGGAVAAALPAEPASQAEKGPDDPKGPLAAAQ